MADKSINDLPAVESLADDGLLPVYQDGGAKRISGEQLRSFAGMNITGATVGQIAKITAVDGTGKPTAWGAVDMPSGGGGGGGGGESAVFYAIYGTTTLAEIKAAYDAGKAVYMKKGAGGGMVYPLIAITSSYAQFAFVAYNGNLRRCTCEFIDNDVWREDDIAPLAEIPVSTAVTLSASGWNSSSKAQTVTVSGVRADETKQLITPTPALASQTAYYNAGIRCTGQSANELTFTAKTIPTSDLTVYVVVQGVSVP